MYALLGEEPADELLPARPVQLWTIVTLEVCVQDDNGRFLLLKLPYYSDQPSTQEGAWAPPFAGYPVPLTYSLPSTRGELSRLFSDFEKSLNVSDVLEQLAYGMGIDSPSFLRRPSFTELKRSPREGSTVKAYRFLRFGVHSHAPASRPNIADPEGRKGHVFLPLDEAHDMVVRSKAEDGTPTWQFLGKPLMSNVAHLLSVDDYVQQIVSHPFRIAASDLYRADSGMVAVFDLAGYGRALRSVDATMRTPSQSGADVATTLRTQLAYWLARFLARAGVFEVQHAGDGFVCAIPTTGSGVQATLGRFLAGYAEFLREIEKLNERLPDDGRLGSRLALHLGPYRYGRVGQAMSAAVGFDGPTIVETARLEAGLAMLVRDDVTVTGSVVAPERTHWIILGSGLDAEVDLAGEMTRGRVEVAAVGVRAVQVKEYMGDAALYRVVDPG